MPLFSFVMDSYDSQSLTSTKTVKVSKEIIDPIKEKLASNKTPLPERFRCVFTLKNLGGPLAIKALATGRCSVVVFFLLNLYSIC